MKPNQIEPTCTPNIHHQTNTSKLTLSMEFQGSIKFIRFPNMPYLEQVSSRSPTGNEEDGPKKSGKMLP